MNVVIVGGGPAGIALGRLLALGGAEVDVLERAESFDRVFRGEGLMPLGIDALAEMGLGALVGTVPGRVVEAWRIFIDGEEVLTVPEPVAKLGDRAFRVASPAALLEGMVADVAGIPGLRVHLGARFTDLARAADGRVVGVEASIDGTARRLTADLVVGCDGRGSTVRTKAGLRLDLDRQQYDVLWFKAPAPADQLGRTDFRIMVRAGHHPLIAYTSWDDRLQAGVVMPKGGLAELGDDGWLDAALGAAPRWLDEHVRRHRGEIEGPIRLNVLVGLAPTWHIAGLLLLGDAAHPMSPVRAQGINLALRDVVVAANHLLPLAAAGPEHARIDAALAAIQAEREPEIRRAQKLQRREAQGQGDARAGTWQYGLARAGARAMGRYRWAQRAWLARQRDLRFGSTDVRLAAGFPTRRRIRSAAGGEPTA